MNKDTWLAENLVPANAQATFKPRRKYLKQIEYSTSTKNTKLVLCILPSWGIYFPPYNLARLAGVTRKAGYPTAVFDINGELHHIMKDVELDSLWHSINYWKWTDKNHYWDSVHPHIEQHLKVYLQRIVDEKPDIVGFSLYDTNVIPSEWLSKEVKKVLPDVTIITGGPSCHHPEFTPWPEINHWVAGEGEQVLLDFLNNFENGVEMPVKLGGTYEAYRIELDTLPTPDYSDYDLSIYKWAGGISAELSRGCVAQCSFCTETWFWKYRDRQASKLITEVAVNKKRYNIDTIWFIDSLLNGNLAELRAFALGLVERNIRIRWLGNARCDGRMDLDYFMDLKNGGCINLSFGVESGSQKVLDLMNKKITVEAVNNNLRDCKKSGIEVFVTWIVGFPNEDFQSTAESLGLVWNNRSNIDGISPGTTFSDIPQTDFSFNRHRYDVCPFGEFFAGGWWKLDWASTVVNRLMRLKYFNIWLFLCKEHGTIKNAQEHGKLKEYYSLIFDNPNLVSDIRIENFNYYIIETNLGSFANSVVNETWSFLRSVWLAKGAFEFSIKADPKSDCHMFGTYLAPDAAKHTYNCYFKIDDQGNFTADFKHEFVHSGERWMEGTKSFNFSWIGNGIWSAESLDTVITSETKSGWADNCVETVSTATREKNLIALNQHYKDKKFIPISS